MNLTGSKWVCVGKREVLRDSRGKTLAQVENDSNSLFAFRAYLPVKRGEWLPVGESNYPDIARKKAELALEAMP